MELDSLNSFQFIGPDRSPMLIDSLDKLLSVAAIIRDTGVPITFASDRGLQFASQEFREFCTEWNVRQRMSSPEFPQSNGHAEAAVKAMKALIKKCTASGRLNKDEFDEAVLEWRNVP